jgi:tRNA pseudouridine38-40 synthase
MSNFRRNTEILDLSGWPEAMHRIASVVEYDGYNYQGFQRQVSARITVQGELEKALSNVANEAITLSCAGRTDAGVHATRQVIHFDTSAERPDKAWREGVNTQLPDAIRIRWAEEVSPKFHARFCAKARTYRYIMICSEVRPAILRTHVSWCRYHLDLDLMQRGANYLVGEHDFSSFRARLCQAASPVRHIRHIRLWKHGDFIVMEIKATAFLYNMVRNIMGSLIEVGRGAKPPEWLVEVLAKRTRSAAATTAAATGLYFVGVDYPDFPEVPSQPQGPSFIV